jgi:glutathione S-transferase
VSELILHHHDPSPFAEKIRLAFGIKQLAWRSVQLSMVMPRPELMPLTGGYRKVPVLQAGADVYCDTGLIARELERRHPAPPLFPAGSEGFALALASWSDRTFFEPGARGADARRRPAFSAGRDRGLRGYRCLVTGMDGAQQLRDRGRALRTLSAAARLGGTHGGNRARHPFRARRSRLHVRRIP